MHAFEEERGFFSLARNLEQVPLWSDYLVVDIERIDGFVTKWIWASVGREPTEPMTLSDADGDGVQRADIPLPDRAGERIGQASVRIEISAWS